MDGAMSIAVPLRLTAAAYSFWDSQCSSTGRTLFQKTVAPYGQIVVRYSKKVRESGPADIPHWPEVAVVVPWVAKFRCSGQTKAVVSQ
jgi:hypothetical protein